MAGYMRMYHVAFTVRGGGEFPLDMLRYDNAVPATTEDAMRAQNRTGTREVRLDRWSPNPDPLPTYGRWASFGWSVVENSEV